MAAFCDKITFSEQTFNPCNNFEWINVDWEEMDCYTVVKTPSGKLQYSLRSVISGKGIGTESGNEYVIRANFGQIFIVNPGETSTQTFTQSVMFIAKGSVPNFIDKFIFHVTITPNGDIITERTYASSKCLG